MNTNPTSIRTLHPQKKRYRRNVNAIKNDEWLVRRSKKNKRNKHINERTYLNEWDELIQMTILNELAVCTLLGEHQSITIVAMRKERQTRDEQIEQRETALDTRRAWSYLITS